jgi:hypothetical protein
MREVRRRPDSGLRGTTPAATGRIARSNGRADVDPARRCRPSLTCRFRLLSAASRNGGSHLDMQPGTPHGPREMLRASPGARVEGALTNGAGTVPMSRPLTDWLRATARSPKRAHTHRCGCGLQRGHQRNCRQGGYMRLHLLLARRAAAEVRRFDRPSALQGGRFHRRAANLVVPPDYFVRTSLP